MKICRTFTVGCPFSAGTTRHAGIPIAEEEDEPGIDFAKFYFGRELLG
jgi:hypothetical protein